MLELPCRTLPRRSRFIGTRSGWKSTRPRRCLPNGFALTSSRSADSSLELLEATAPDSPIRSFLDKRGPGLHHITLRVDDIHAAVAHLKARSAKLVDEQPRPGAEGSLVAFIHPSAAHGVLVELKQSAAAADSRHASVARRSEIARTRSARWN